MSEKAPAPPSAAELGKSANGPDGGLGLVGKMVFFIAGLALIMKGCFYE